MTNQEQKCKCVNYKSIHMTNIECPVHCHPERESKEEKCVPDGLIYTSYPSQLKCKNCGQFWVPIRDEVPTCRAPHSEGKEHFTGNFVIETKPTNEGWKEELESKIKDWDIMFPKVYIEPALNLIEDFISQLLSAQRMEIHKILRDYIRNYAHDTEAHRQGKCSYPMVSICAAEEHKIKAALSDVQELIKKGV